MQRVSRDSAGDFPKEVPFVFGIFCDEIASAYMEDIAADPAVWEYILAMEPTAKEKALSFFRKAARDYSFDEGMSREARRYLRHFKKLFDSFSERNFQGNAAEVQKAPLTSKNGDSVRVTGDNDKDNETRYAIKYPSFSEADISSNMDDIADMEAVAAIDASKLEKTGKSPMDTFNEYFSSLGNNIASETFGDIALPKSSAKSEIRHGITAEKIASIEAIPSVIEQGKVIFHKAKEGGVERIVVCAPIKIGEADYYMGVMLQRDSRYQRLYLHNVVSVAIEREATSSSKDNLVTTGALENENHLSITSIIQKALNVKAEKQKILHRLLKTMEKMCGMRCRKHQMRMTRSTCGLRRIRSQTRYSCGRWWRMRRGQTGSTPRCFTTAPIRIVSVDYFMRVMLQRDTQTQYLYLHNIAIEKEAQIASETHRLTTGVNESDSRLFITSILQKALNVKVEKQKNKNRASRRRPGCKNILRHNASHCLHY